MSNSDERQLLAEREQQTFHELYLKHHRLVYGICFRITKDGR